MYVCLTDDFSVPVAPPPPGLQNVEQFGPILGEEIVANWRRSLERHSSEPKKVYISPNRHEITGKETSLDISYVLLTTRGGGGGLDNSICYFLNFVPPFLLRFTTYYADLLNDGVICFSGRDKSPESVKSPPAPSTSPPPTSSSSSPPPSSQQQQLSANAIIQPSRSASRSGTPSCKSPTSESNGSPRLNNSSPHNNNNNNPSQLNNNNNNNIPTGLINGLCGLNVGLNNNILGPAGALGFDLIKPPFDHRSTYRFGDGDCTMVGRFGESLIPKGDPMEARLQEMLRYVQIP